MAFRRRREPYIVKTPVTALIDIVFLLLVYFLLTTNFITDEGITIKLPQATAAAPQTEREITVQVDRDGRTYLGHEPVPHDQLLSSLRARINGRDNIVVVVRADRAIVLNKAVRVLDMARAAGAARLCLATEKPL